MLRHNLRNSLNVALALLDVVMDEGDERRELLVVREQLDDLVALSRDAQNLEQLWRNDDETVVDLARVVRERAAVVRTTHQAVEVRTDLPERAPVSAHPRLAYAVAELLDNAARHNDADAPRVTAVVSPTAGAAGATRLDVVDNGPGIPPDEVAVLDRAEETSLEHGTGLGLWLVYWTVVQSDGTVTVRDDDPRGTVVRVTLPRAR